MPSVKPAVRRALAVLLLSLAACGTSDSPGAASSTTGGGAAAPIDSLPAGCNPLRTAGACLLPYPSAVFLDADSTAATGYKLALTSDLFPKNNKGKAFDPTRISDVDGFSPQGQILAYFPERLDAASLAPLAHPEKSLDPKSATVIVDMTTHELVAHFAELDAEVVADDDRQALILRPMARLTGAHRYAVAVTRSLRTAAGGTPSQAPGWAAIVAGTAKDAMGQKQAARMPDILGALAQAGVAQTDVLLAWDFVTASDESLTRTMVAARDRTLTMIGDAGLGYTITSVEDDFSTHALRRVRGTFKTPKFLSSTDVKIADTHLVLDAQGLPTASGTYDAPFTLILPRYATFPAAKGALRLLVFGHGFLGSGESELGGAGGSYLQDLADQYHYAIVATDWSGLSKYEGLDATGSQAAGQAVQDMNQFPYITDRLHQALVNVLTLTRTAQHAIANDPKLQVNGAGVIDTSRVDYYGVSLGGVMGSALMGLSPDLQRAVLNVGAAGWTTLIQRSINWTLFKLFVDGAYPDKLDQQILVDVLQSHFDPVDGMSYTPHLFGKSKTQILLQMSVGDMQVSNVATEIYARSAKLGLLAETPAPIYGLTATAGPLGNALTVWDTHPMPLPPMGNQPGDALSMNNAHTAIRTLPKLTDQIDHFVQTGAITSTCTGPCDPE